MRWQKGINREQKRRDFDEQPSRLSNDNLQNKKAIKVVHFYGSKNDTEFVQISYFICKGSSLPDDQNVCFG